MTIDDLYDTCYPPHATEPTRVTVEAPKQAEEVNPEQTAEKAGEVAENAIENINPETNEQGNMPTNTSAESTEGVNNEETAGN